MMVNAEIVKSKCPKRQGYGEWLIGQERGNEKMIFQLQYQEVLVQDAIAQEYVDENQIRMCG